MRKLIEKLLWLPLLILPATFVIGACEVDRSHITEVEGDTTVVVCPPADPDTVFSTDTLWLDTLWLDTLFADTLWLDTLFATDTLWLDTLFVTDTLTLWLDTLFVTDTLWLDTLFIEVPVDTLAIFEQFCTRRRGNSNNWICTYSPGG